MKLKIHILAILILYTIGLFSQDETAKFEKADCFFAEASQIFEGLNIDWGYVNLPENWDTPNGKKIKIAVAVLKSKNGSTNADPLVYVDGGPGESGVQKIWYFWNSSIQENRDIVLVDLRGTGFSEPSLCPDLGKEFFKILALNQTKESDEHQKQKAALACKEDLLKRDIDVNEYNSKSISRDLHEIKKVLGFATWNVYGISYGTQIAKVYAQHFPDDISALILDSSISDINNYYTNNTSNYINSLTKMFDACKQNPECNQQYPDLRKTYFSVIEQLSKKPIKIEVNEDLIPLGQFTYNVEDFKIAIQQSLYQKDVIEVLPPIIAAFKKENKFVLSALVESFSEALGLDYGHYFCVTCNEVIPKNSHVDYTKDAAQYDGLKGSLSFYNSDFKVCKKWNNNNEITDNLNDTIVNSLASFEAPVLIFSGDYDPITPATNGKQLAEIFPNSTLVEFKNYGHVPSISKIGFQTVADFINNDFKVKNTELKQELNFASNLSHNNGILGFAKSLGEFDILFFSPLFIALLILIISIVAFSISFIKRSTKSGTEKSMNLLMLLTSLTGLITFSLLAFTTNNVANSNELILVFGLPGEYNFIFIIQILFVILIIISLVFFILKLKKIPNAIVFSSILFSHVLLTTYFVYWGFF